MGFGAGLKAEGYIYFIHRLTCGPGLGCGGGGGGAKVILEHEE